MLWYHVIIIIIIIILFQCLNLTNGRNTQSTYSKANRGGLCNVQSHLTNHIYSKTGKEINKIK